MAKILTLRGPGPKSKRRLRTTVFEIKTNPKVIFLILIFKYFLRVNTCSGESVNLTFPIKAGVSLLHFKANCA